METAAFSKLAWRKRIQQRYLVVALFAGHLVCVFRGAVSFLHHLCSNNPDNADSPSAKVCYTMEGKNSPYGVENTNQAFWLTLGVAETAKVDSDGWMDHFFLELWQAAQPKLMLEVGKMAVLVFFQLAFAFNSYQKLIKNIDAWYINLCNYYQYFMFFVLVLIIIVVYFYH